MAVFIYCFLVHRHAKCMRHAFVLDLDFLKDLLCYPAAKPDGVMGGNQIYVCTGSKINR